MTSGDQGEIAKGTLTFQDLIARQLLREGKAG